MIATQLITSLCSAPDGARRGVLHELENLANVEDVRLTSRPLRRVDARFEWLEAQFGPCVRHVTEALLIKLGYMVFSNDYPKLAPLIPWIGREIHRLRKSFPEAWVFLDAACALDVAWDDDGGILATVLDAVPRLVEDNRTVIDWYMELDRRPDILRMDMKDAFDDAHAWHEQLRVSAEKGMPRPGVVVLNMGPLLESGRADGWTLQELDTRKRIEVEGKTMGHCVSGLHYWEGVRDGRFRIFSLRDPAGRPWATLQVGITGDSPEIIQVKGRGNVNVANYESGKLDGLDDGATCIMIRDLAVIAAVFLLTGSTTIGSEELDLVKEAGDMRMSVGLFGQPWPELDGEDDEDEHDEHTFPQVLACPACGNVNSDDISAYVNTGMRIHISAMDGQRSRTVSLSAGDGYEWGAHELKLECLQCAHEWDFPVDDIAHTYDAW